jgi:hypothetical protein
VAAVRILVTGSRKFTDRRVILRALFDTVAEWGDAVPTIVHGDAPGADQLAKKIARKHCWPTEPHPADWETHGRSAGPRRNIEMVKLGADICLAFLQNGEKNVGTRHCATLAEQAGIPVRWFHNA